MPEISAYSYADTPLHDLVPTKDAEIQAAMARSWNDTGEFAKWLLPSFDKQMDSQRRQMLAKIDDETLPKCCFEASRSIGKTALMVDAKVLKSIVMRQRKFIMIVGASLHNVITYITEPLKQELLQNKDLNDIFVGKKGQGFKVREFQDTNAAFGKDGWYVANPHTGEPMCFILPKGMEQSFRGARIRIMGKMMRPDLIVVDDVEKDEEVENEESRRKIRAKFAGALLNCVDSSYKPESSGEFMNRWRPDYSNPRWMSPWRVLYGDTPKHRDANIRHIKTYSDWDYIRCARVYYDSTKKEYFSSIPDIPGYSHADIRHAIRVAKEDPSGIRWKEYQKEVMCEVNSVEDREFIESMFKPYSEEDHSISPKYNTTDTVRFLTVDPAKTGLGRACTAIMAVAANSKKQQVFIRGLVNKKIGGGEAYSEIVDACIKWQTRIVFLEVTGVEGVGPYMLETELKKRGLYGKVKIFEVNTQQRKNAPTYDNLGAKNSAKRARLRTLLPFYKSGHIYHEESIKGSAYEQQLLDFPEPSAWDAADCGGHIPSALEALHYYFAPIIKPWEDNPVAFLDDRNDFEECGRFFADETNWMGAA